MRRIVARRWSPALALAAVALWTPSPAAGAGATYTVVQCHTENRGHADARIHEPRPYGITTACGDPASEHAIQINNRLRAEKNRSGTVRWIAPEATGLAGVRVQAKLRRARGHYSRLFMADAQGRQTNRIAAGGRSREPFRAQAWKGTSQRQFVAVLGCRRDRGCETSGAAKTWLRQVRLTVADFADPEVAVDGSLLSGGWKRGSHGIATAVSDEGSGVLGLSIAINRIKITAESGACSGLSNEGVARMLVPCEPESLPISTNPNTAVAPFREGQNSVSICAHDFAGNRSCDNRQVQVDNTPPALAFANAQDPEDPELIHAVVSDAHSGVADGEIFYRAEGASVWQPLETVVVGGELQARVDSTAVSAGVYEFRALASDVAGNGTETTRRTDGFEMRLTFPLKAGVDLNAHLEPGGSKRMTIEYGKRSRVAGLLREASGEPIPGQEVVIEEYFGDGALIRERITRVETDADGRWHERLPAGPSRRVTAHYAGTQRYLPESTLGGRLAVRTKASLRTSRARVPEGKRVTFRGRLGRLGARIPTGGKLLELQVKQDKRTYQTVGQGFRSRPGGRYRIRYRFGRFYQYDVRFRFRIKVARESDWPYKAPVRSRVRKVTVLDR